MDTPESSPLLRIGELSRRLGVSDHVLRAWHPDLVVVAATLPDTLEPLTAPLTALARRAPLALAGAGATPEIASAVGARLMMRNPVTEAEQTSWPR